jgi:hypothetical protein
MEQPRLDTRSHRSMRTARHVARERLIATVAVAALFVVGAGALALIAPGRPAGAAAAPADAWRSVTPSETPVAVPTPVFVSLRGVRLHLPVPARAVTAVAFHQSSYTETVPMTALVPFVSPSGARKAVDAARTARNAGQEATIAATPPERESDDAGVWTGSMLELWRSGSGGRQDTAVDCGASPGTPVFSPVDGTVMEIRPYKLYGRVDDFEIHIKPDAWNDLDLIVLHVTDPALAVGTRVTAGVTRIASVRRLVGRVSGLQLRTYTLDGGNHTHFQLNKIPKPDETWIVGSDPPGFVRHH